MTFLARRPGRLGALFAGCLLLHAAGQGSLLAQPAPQATTAQPGTVDSFNTEQLDALLAPIALYPDALLTQILMAATFPLQVVQAARWLEDPANKQLSGDALTKALEAQSWDPSVKSLVPFPQVLAMMNANLDWLQQLGYAFANQQADVLDAVQRLRRQAQMNGSLQSSPQQVVRTDQQAVVIEPAQPNVVYVPSYNPTVVYGAWPYPSYPPVYLPPPVGYPVGAVLAAGLAFGVGVAVTAGLWNWARPVWGGGHVNVNVNRYNNINIHRTAITSNIWQANRTGGRPAGLARPPRGPVGQPARPAGLPAGAIGRPHVSVPSSAVRPPTAGARPAVAQPGTRPGLGNRPDTNRPGVNRPGVNRPGPNQPIANRPGVNRPGVNRPAGAGAFSGINEGRQATQFGQRGMQSRAAAEPRRPAGGARAGGRIGGRQ